jgi:hypothetical protein
MPTNLPSAKRSTRNAGAGMSDLFGEPDLPVRCPAEVPEGFRYVPDVLTSAQEKSLVTQFEKLPLKPFEFHGYHGNRRIYTFGRKYIFAG